jgi:hypothetical protein
MANLASLVVSLTTKTEPFRKGMKRSETTLQKFRASVKRSAVALTALGTVAATAALAIATRLTKAGLANVDATAKMADRLGLTTEALLELQFAAKATAGVNEATLNMALQRMTRRLSEAAQGTGEAVKALEELGLSAQALAALSPDEQFKAIADAMAKVPSQADKVRLSFKLFDSEGVALVNTLALGSKGLDEMGRELSAIGGTFDNVAAKSVEAANDALLKLSSIVAAVGNELAITLAPIITDVANRTIEWVKASGGVGEIMVPAFEKLLGLTDRFIQFGNVIRGVFNVIQGVGGALLTVLSGIVEGVAALGNVVGLVSDETLDFLFNLTNELAKGVATDFAEAGEAFTDAFDSDKATKFFDAATSAAKSAAESAANEARKITDQFQQDVIEKLATGPVEAVKKQIEAVVKDSGAGIARAGGGNFRLDASVSRTQDRQLTVLEKIRDLISAQPTEQIFVQEVGL